MGDDKSQLEKDTRFLLDTLKRKSGVVSQALGKWREHLRLAQNANKSSQRDRKTYDACLSHNIGELRRITHQINACLKACKDGDIEEMERLRDQILNEKVDLN